MLNLKEALKIVVAESGNGYATTYAEAALKMGGATKSFQTEWEGKKTIRAVSVTSKATGKMMEGEELKTQLKHVLNNLSSWTGEKAEEVKAVLKENSK